MTKLHYYLLHARSPTFITVYILGNRDEEKRTGTFIAFLSFLLSLSPNRHAGGMVHFADLAFVDEF